jgi:hypothetical protein
VARLISANGIGEALTEAKAFGATSDKFQMSPSSAVRTVHRLLSPGPMPTQMNEE